MFPRTSSVVIGIGVALLASVPLMAQQPPSDPPPGPGLDIIKGSCVGCHDIYMISTKRKTREEWAATVALMADRGAEITPEDAQIIVDYLSENFPKGAADTAPSK
jgi:mono/diheme cytochrome c family protein